MDGIEATVQKLCGIRHREIDGNLMKFLRVLKASLTPAPSYIYSFFQYSLQLARYATYDPVTPAMPCIPICLG